MTSAANKTFRTLHYNVHFKDGSLANRVTVRELCGLRPVDIAWVWNVSVRRRVAPDEILKLRKLNHER
jgi:squalene cyclase